MEDRSAIIKSSNLLQQRNFSSLEKLDWYQIKTILQSHCLFEESKQHFDRPPEYQRIADIEMRYDCIEECLQILHTTDQIWPNEFSNLDREIEWSELNLKLSKDQVLSIRELNQVCLLIEGCKPLVNKVHTWLDKTGDELTNKDFYQLVKQFSSPFRSFVTTDGIFQFHKHPEIGPLFEKSNLIEKNLRHQCEKIQREWSDENLLQNSSYDILYDYFVLAVRSDRYQGRLGKIISRSSSGNTLWVEPNQIRDQVQERINILNQINYFVDKFCREQCNFLLNYLHIYKNLTKVILKLDYHLALAQTNYQLNLKRPKISNDNTTIRFNCLFHPLIMEPITNNVCIEQQEDGFIISGPNTGGKTVLLKAMALNFIFPHIGLFSCAEDATFPIYDAVYYFGEDSQDLKSGLSSFSSEVSNYIQSFLEKHKTPIYFFDEIFNSTSSEEASALTLSLLDYIKENTSYSKVFISTHHSLLKTAIHKSGHYVSGHMQFDIENANPTYRLIVGQPGSSYAFSIFDKIAAQYDFPFKMSAKAKHFLKKEQLQYESLLQELDRKNIELAEILKSKKEKLLSIEKREHGLELEVSSKKKAILEKFEKKISKKLDQAEELINQIRRGDKSPKKLIESSHQIKTELRNEKAAQNVPEISLIKPEALIVNNFYYYQKLSKVIKLESISKDQKNFSGLVGTLKIKGKSHELYIDKNYRPPKKKLGHTNTRNLHSDQAKIEFDCRGFRLEDFKDEVMLAFEQLRTSSTPFITIIHGHGDGVLKSWLRKYLRTQKEFEWEVTPQYQDGATTIRIKDY